MYIQTHSMTVFRLKHLGKNPGCEYPQIKDGPIVSIPGASVNIGGIISKGVTDGPIEKRKVKPKYERGDYVYERRRY